MTRWVRFQFPKVVPHQRPRARKPRPSHLKKRQVRVLRSRVWVLIRVAVDISPASVRAKPPVRETTLSITMA